MRSISWSCTEFSWQLSQMHYFLVQVSQIRMLHSFDKISLLFCYIDGFSVYCWPHLFCEFLECFPTSPSLTSGVDPELFLFSSDTLLFWRVTWHLYNRSFCIIILNVIFFAKFFNKRPDRFISSVTKVTKPFVYFFNHWSSFMRDQRFATGRDVGYSAFLNKWSFCFPCIII